MMAGRALTVSSRLPPPSWRRTTVRSVAPARTRVGVVGAPGRGQSFGAAVQVPAWWWGVSAAGGGPPPRARGPPPGGPPRGGGGFLPGPGRRARRPPGPPGPAPPQRHAAQAVLERRPGPDRETAGVAVPHVAPVGGV